MQRGYELQGCRPLFFLVVSLVFSLLSASIKSRAMCDDSGYTSVGVTYWLPWRLGVGPLSDLEFLAGAAGRKLRFLSPRVNINIKFATLAQIKGLGPRGIPS